MALVAGALCLSEVVLRFEGDFSCRGSSWASRFELRALGFGAGTSDVQEWPSVWAGNKDEGEGFDISVLLRCFSVDTGMRNFKFRG